MRDLALVGIFLFAIPYMLKRPALGVVMWVWLSVMNPHRLAYGFAHEMPFAAGCAAITLLGLASTKEEKRLPIAPPVVALFMFMMWMCITSLFPFHSGSGYDMWSRVMKIIFMAFVAMSLIHSRKEINYVVWAIVFSLAFYGTKGGIFTLATGGGYLVWGPEGSFIEGNNELALALVMTIPLMRYVQLGLKKRWQKLGMTAVMMLCVFSALGSHSRGALVAISAMALTLWWKSRNKFVMGFMLVAAGVLALGFMPQEWWNRMNTIKTYDADSSALGRINAWWMAFNLAKDRLVGGGYDIYDFDVFGRYAPDPLDVHAAHSIYFQIMGEHGFIGLACFLSIGATTWFMAGRTKRAATGTPDLLWAVQLMEMVKVCMVGYGVGGAFLSLAYFDVPYYLVVLVVATNEFVKRAPKSQVVRNDWRGGADRFVRPRAVLAGADSFGLTTVEPIAEPQGYARATRAKWP